MDYLRTLGSAAVSSLVQKSGLNLPFSLGQKVTSFDNTSIWSLYDGTKRVCHHNCTLFLVPYDNTRTMALRSQYSNSMVPNQINGTFYR